MDRRRFLLTSLAGALAAPRVSAAQQAAGPLPRIGVLLFLPMTQAAQEDFRRGLRDHRYVEGKNVLLP